MAVGAGGLGPGMNIFLPDPVLIEKYGFLAPAKG